MKIITLGGVGQEANTYILIVDGCAAVVDPAVSIERITAALEKESAHLEAILLTHAHSDHTKNVGALRKKYAAPLMLGKEDADMLHDARLNLSEYILGFPETFDAAERLLSDGDTVQLGGERLTVLHLPGHTRGSVAYMSDRAIICGDTVFAAGFGRYDLPTGNPMMLKSSLKRLSELDGELMLFPGHGTSCRIKDAQALKQIKNY